MAGGPRARGRPRTRGANRCRGGLAVGRVRRLPGGGDGQCHHQKLARRTLRRDAGVAGTRTRPAHPPDRPRVGTRPPGSRARGGAPARRGAGVVGRAGRRDAHRGGSAGSRPVLLRQRHGRAPPGGGAGQAGRAGIRRGALAALSAGGAPLADHRAAAAVFRLRVGLFLRRRTVRAHDLPGVRAARFGAVPAGGCGRSDRLPGGRAGRWCARPDRRRNAPAASSTRGQP